MRAVVPGMNALTAPAGPKTPMSKCSGMSILLPVDRIVVMVINVAQDFSPA